MHRGRNPNRRESWKNEPTSVETKTHHVPACNVMKHHGIGEATLEKEKAKGNETQTNERVGTGRT